MPDIFFVVHPRHRVTAEFGVEFGGVRVETEFIVITHGLKAALKFFSLRTGCTFAFLAALELDSAYTGGTAFSKFTDGQIGESFLAGDDFHFLFHVLLLEL